MELGFGMSVDPINILITALQELCKRIGHVVIELEDQGKDIMIEKESLCQFSGYVSEINMILQVLKANRVENSTESMATRSALRNLNSQLKQACEVIEKYKSGSRLWLLFNYRSMLKQMEQSAKGISETVSMLGMGNHDPTWSLKSKIEKLASNLRLLEFQSTPAMEATALKIEELMAQNGRNMEFRNKLLERIMAAVGATTNTLFVREELVLLRREKEMMEAQKKQAEALRLSQLIGEGSTSYSSVAITENANRQAIIVNSSRQLDLISSFKCPLSGKVMEDPVAILCGHSFERDAIRKHFDSGEKTCPVCEEEIMSLELTPNISLRSTIHEWKQRELDEKLQRAVPDINSDDPNRVSQALEDLKDLMEMPRYRAAVAEQGLVPKIVLSLKAGSRINMKAALKCLCYLVNHSEENKRAIVEAGAIHYIQKLFRKGEAQPDAVAILVELAEKEEFAEEIGNTNCIPFLVSLLENHNPDISQKAEKVVENLSSNTHFVIKMADAGYFQPFLVRFNQGPSETQARMATALVQMQLNEVKVKVFEHKQFVGALVRVLSSSTPAYRSACLQCIKKLSAYPTMAKYFLAEAATIPALLGLISFFSSDPQWRQVATEILTSLIEPSQLSEFEANPNLQELQSHHNIGVFLHFVTIEASTPETKTQFLRLLRAIGNKSVVARGVIRTDKDAITHLFSSLNSSHPDVIRQTLKLIYCIAEEHPDGIPLPPLPAKEMAINALVMIFTHSPEVEDRSIAAGIMSRLPLEDTTVDDILCQSEALKAIREVICTEDGMHFAPTPIELLQENALAALLRFAEPNKPKLRKQLSDLELYPSLVQVLTSGSSCAKQRTATVLARLSQPTVESATDTDVVRGAADKKSLKPLMFLASLLPMSSRCCNSASLSSWGSPCSVHGSACSSRQTFCLVKSDAVRPLVQTLSEKDAAEAALLALETLLKDQTTLSSAASTIAESQGVAAILDVLEKGTLPAKEKALDLFQILYQHTNLSQQQFRRSERILIQLLDDEALKKKAALVLSDMDIISKQSSFF
ncbi:U-box domain-containing protein 44-like protein isoform X1 [Cinnamomum micranthum f. kanehirae]|uniref:RING-type E3 ubiquitin transferase n=1 Tax=Cinnamomum micranthum f. kanehirae TaxID=337451 RepID=A0A3S3MNL0_9MAGN|nr:U-box domain-containing protein 44-like protein isoform X1 [Cinnamomum micranthum f. kanehirae]